MCLFAFVLYKALFWISFAKVEAAPEEIPDEDIEDPAAVVGNTGTGSGSGSGSGKPSNAIVEADNGTVANTSANMSSMSMSSQTSEYAEKLKVLKAPIIFVCIYILNMCSLEALRIQQVSTAVTGKNVFDAWTMCVFTHFYDGYDELFPDDYHNVDKRNAYAFDACGVEPASQYNPVLVFIAFLTIFAAPIYISFIFCKTDACAEALCCRNRGRVYNKSSYDSNQSFVTMHVDEIKEYNQPSAYYEE